MAQTWLAALVALNTFLIGLLWISTRHEKLGRRFRKALLRADPIKPIRQPPQFGNDDLSSLADMEERLFLEDFREFSDVLNDWLQNTPWRVQELPDIELTLTMSDSPDFGRRYEVYHCAAKIGLMEISPGIQYRIKSPATTLDLEIEWVRLLSYKSVHDFLYAVAAHVCESRGQEWAEATSNIDRAMTEVVWQSQRLTEQRLPNYGTLELQLHGHASWYLQRRSR
jgi:hypothetical protein